jgi:hypothetical protein
VVGRLILLIILGFVTALYFPDSREMMIDKAMPVLKPMLVWNAEREIEELSRAVRREQRTTYQLPPTRQWSAWLVTNFTGDAATDPWGTTRSYQAWPDFFAIRSDGPDGQRASPDDLRIVWHRPF